MKRLTLAALVAALALTTSVGVAAAAGDGARSSAGKAPKGKQKSCKGKGKGKGKTKAKGNGKRSATSSARTANCKGKGCKKQGKKRNCKGNKGKGKGNKGGGGWPLNGYYEGREGIALSVSGRGRKVRLDYSPSSAKTCIEHAGIGLEATSVTSDAASFSAAGEGTLPNGQYSWSIAVDRGLGYRVTISSSSVNPFYGPCDRPGAVFTGKLKKAR